MFSRMAEECRTELAYLMRFRPSSSTEFLRQIACIPYARHSGNSLQMQSRTHSTTYRNAVTITMTLLGICLQNVMSGIYILYKYTSMQQCRQNLIRLCCRQRCPTDCSSVLRSLVLCASGGSFFAVVCTYAKH